MTTESVIDNDTGTVIPEETTKGIMEMNAVAAGLAEMQATYKQVPDVDTEEGYTEAKRLGREVGKIRISVDKARKAAKDFYIKGGRDIDAKAKQIAAVIGPLESQYTDAVRAVDERKAAEEAEKTRIEQERIDTITDRLDRIKALPTTAVTLEQVESALIRLDQIDLSTFDEFDEAADEYITASKSALTDRKTELVKQAHEKAELDRQRKEQEAAAEKLKAEQDEIDRQRQELEKREAAEQARIAAEKKAESDRIAAEKQAEIDKQEAIEKARREEREAAEAEKQRIAAEQAEKERQAEEKRKAYEAAALEAQRIAAMAPDADKLRAWLDSIPELPEMSTDEGNVEFARAHDCLLELGESIRQFQHSVKTKVA